MYVYNDSSHKQRFEAIVHDIINCYTLKLGISEKLIFIKNSKYDIEFDYDKTIFKLMHASLEKVSKNINKYKNILFPESIINKPSEQKPIKMWFDMELNDEQKKAVSNILYGKFHF